jgi:hypothetical protein
MGANDYGQCDVPAPDPVFVTVAAGERHSLALKADGTIVTWGYGAGAEPHGTCVALAAGGFHSLAVGDLRLDRACCYADTCETLSKEECLALQGDWNLDLPICDTARCPTSGLSDGASVPIATRADPNPMTTSTRISYWIPLPGSLAIEITDVSGRVVRRVVAHAESEGAGSVVWNGTNDAGNRVAPGIYFVRVLSPTRMTRTHIVVLG